MESLNKELEEVKEWYRLVSGLQEEGIKKWQRTEAGVGLANSRRSTKDRRAGRSKLLWRVRILIAIIS